MEHTITESFRIVRKMGMGRFIIKMGFLTKALSRMIPRMERVWRSLLMGLSLEEHMSKMRRMGRGYNNLDQEIFIGNFLNGRRHGHGRDIDLNN